MNADLLARHPSRSSHTPLITVLTCLFLAGTDAAVAQSGVGISGRLEYIENPLRLSESDQHEVLTELTANALLERQTKRFYTNLNYTARKSEYSEDLQNDRSYVVGSGLVSWIILPDRFNWDLSNTRTNQLIDIAKPDIEDNFEVIDITATGPTANFQFSSLSSLRLSAQQARVNYEDSEFLDQERMSYSAIFSRNFSSRFTGSINSSFDDVVFGTFDEINYRSLNLSASATLADETYQFSIEAGEHSSERAGLKILNPILIVSALYTVNSRLELTAQYSENVTDTITNLRSPREVDTSFQPSENEIDQLFGKSNFANLYRRKVSTFGATYTQPSSYTLALRYGNAKRSPLDLDLDEANEYVSASLQIPVNNRLSLVSTFLYSELDLTQQNRSQSRQVFRVNLAYRLSEGINLVLGAGDIHQKEKGDNFMDAYDGRNYFISLSIRR